MLKYIASVGEFEEVVQQPFSMIVFSATWCKPCTLLKEWLKSDYADVEVVVVDIDDPELEPLCKHISSLPTIEIHKSGEMVFAVEGYRKDNIEEQLKLHLAETDTSNTPV